MCYNYAINVCLSSLESKQNYLKASIYENGASDTKKLELVYKMNQPSKHFLKTCKQMFYKMSSVSSKNVKTNL